MQRHVKNMQINCKLFPEIQTGKIQGDMAAGSRFSLCAHISWLKSQVLREDKKISTSSEVLTNMRLRGLEPRTPWLRVRCSTNWARSAFFWLLISQRKCYYTYLISKMQAFFSFFQNFFCRTVHPLFIRTLSRIFAQLPARILCFLIEQHDRRQDQKDPDKSREGHRLLIKEHPD